ncbi:putative E3 ubiquitin ligase complex SCF subunit scon-2 [Cytospora mali]|uniref:E3 ubiquitin ligase complex SCF subunit scon-2 n=1 Tax=Cytospora mali TaxID=578113 RepID=A0A194UV95_CYTMA|nr:putative E3 ubiquitin ligase complex SCF subunit scon-2 [Valsa mali var. pyri (nom. inval.)]
MDHPAAASSPAISRRPSRGNDASLRANGATKINIYNQPFHQYRRDTRLHFPTSPPQTEDGEIEPSHFDLPRLKELNCDRRRPEEEQEDKSRLVNMSPTLVGQTVTPFLKEHVPSLYAPVSKIESTHSHQLFRQNDYNSKYCYRHSPDSKCRKAADENKMAMIQTELEKLPQADQQAITHVWSLFSAAPSKHRELMIQGILSSSCFPQLSLVSREVQAQLKIDFISALPNEISIKILSYLDTVSLCKAARVSRHWRVVADDDTVWHRMCEQHIDRKCTKCGWGLPLLERNKLRNWTRRRQIAASHKPESSDRLMPLSPPMLPLPNSPKAPGSPKRNASPSGDEVSSKRQCLSRVGSAEDAVEQRRPWKDVYRDRWQIGVNWKLMRYSLKTFKGHTNGVTCLQIWDDTTLATGSYDNTIKIWDLESGREVRTLSGHTRGIRSLQMDESKLLSASLDGTVKVWNWRTGQCLRTLSSHSDGVISVHFQDEVVATGSIDHTIRVYNFQTKEAFCLKHHEDWVNNVKVDMASRTLLSSSDDCTVVLWDLDTRKVIREFVGHVGHVQQVLSLPHDFEPDEDPATAGQDPTETMSVASGRSSTPVYPQPISSIGNPDLELRAAYGPGFVDQPDRPLPARYILSGGLDASLKLWDTATARVVRNQWGHLEGIWSVECDSLRIVTGANDSLVKTWDPRSGRCTGTFGGHTGPVTSVAVSDALMASGSEDGEVRLYNFKMSDGCRRSTSPGTPSTS